MKEILSEVRKRDGRIVSFDQTKITNAIFKAMRAVNEKLKTEGKKPEGSLEDAKRISDEVVKILRFKYRSGGIPGIEEIQNIVEETLMRNDFFATAKAYILYRDERAKIRAQKKMVPEHLKNLIEESKKYFQNPYCEFIYFRTYSRWDEEEGRRETWLETVKRYVDFMKENLGNRLTNDEYDEIHRAILAQKVMPSMRLLWSAKIAAKKSNVSAYNCAYIAPKTIRDFGEIMYILMCGTGVGFSCEEHIIQNLPQIKPQRGLILPTYVVEDSKEGWSEALVKGMNVWFNGLDIRFDFSKIRPYGSRLKTMGGFASGPEALKNILDFVRKVILSRQGKRLKPINVHDIICKIGEGVVMGGVRRSAEISLSDLDDLEMRYAKSGEFWKENPQRFMANNSAVYLEKPSAKEFMEEWLALMKSGSGERGIFYRGGLKTQLPERRWNISRQYLSEFGTNPCGEILLRSKEFCNLTEVVARPNDNIESLEEKIKIATILGTYQATLTNFPYLSKEWKENCEEERLLGVSITGQWDCPVVRNPEVLIRLKETAIEINKIYAKRFDINPSTAITCVKPSGNVSQLVNSSSGMHPRYSRYYLRRVEIDSSDPLFMMLKDQKVPYYPKTGQAEGRAHTYVLEFPIKSPKNSITRYDLNAIDQLEYWKMVKLNFTEHNPSITIYIADDEWLEVGNWLYKNFEILGGLSFLPKEEHIYPLAPYKEITEREYQRAIESFPEIDFSQILVYEKEDQTKGFFEPACSANKCEI